eukprot:8170196-Prorocentrum_lima.AAC.1
MHEQSYGNPKRLHNCDDRLVAAINRQQSVVSPGDSVRLQFFDMLLNAVEKNPTIARASDWVATLGGEHTG